MTLTVILRPFIMLLPKCKTRKPSAQRVINKLESIMPVSISTDKRRASPAVRDFTSLSDDSKQKANNRRQKLFIPRTRRTLHSWSIFKRLEHLNAPDSSGYPAIFSRNGANIDFLRLALHSVKPTSFNLVEIDQGPGLTNYLTKHKGNLSLLNFSLTLWYPFLPEFIKGWESLALLSKHPLLTPWKDNKVKEIQKGHLYELGVFVCLVLTVTKHMPY